MGNGAGYAGDVWPQQPAAPEHPWRHMPNHAMTPHISGTTLDAQVHSSSPRKLLQLLEQWPTVSLDDMVKR